MGRSGGATQSSLPTALVYNGPVRMAAGAPGEPRKRNRELTRLLVLRACALLGPARWLLCPLTRSGFEAESTVVVRATAGIDGSMTLQFIPYTEENPPAAERRA